MNFEILALHRRELNLLVQLLGQHIAVVLDGRLLLNCRAHLSKDLMVAIGKPHLLERLVVVLLAE